jgi:nitroreductase
MKSVLQKFVPFKVRKILWDRFRAPIRLISLEWYSARRFWKYNLNEKNHPEANIEKAIMMFAHVIEKGFSLRDTRMLFGQGNVKALVSYIRKSEALEHPNPCIQQIGVQALAGYLQAYRGKARDKAEEEFLVQLEKDVAGFKHLGESEAEVTLEFTPAEVAKLMAGGAGSVVSNRHSLRQYKDEMPDMDLVREAIREAQRSPSACNLQPYRIHLLTDRKLIDQALGFQEGAKGFSEQVPMLFVLSYDVGRQLGPRSRRQGACDTGLFAMALMLALLGKGIGSCPLNWAKDIKPDKGLRKLVSIPPHEEIVLCMSAGYLPDRFEVALSRRLPVDSILTIHEGK